MFPFGGTIPSRETDLGAGWCCPRAAITRSIGGNIHFISLDTVVSLTKAVDGSSEMLEWLEKDLRNTQQFWRIVYFHQSPYGTGLNENDPDLPLIRERIVPLLERYGVQLVFAGHEHSYQRTLPLRDGRPADAGTGIVYITTGEGGGDLYPVYPSSLVAVGRSAYHYVLGG